MTGPRSADARVHIRATTDACLQAVEPAGAVSRTLETGSFELPTGRYGIVAVGKAAVGMAGGFVRAASRQGTEVGFGVVIRPRGGPVAEVASPLVLLESDHPTPTLASLAAAEAALGVADRCRREGCTLIVLVSGGASALMAAPEPGLTIEDLADVGRALSNAGASIEDLNAVRQHCDRVKGGGLARAAGAAPVSAMVLSDVMGNPISLIGSGPAARPASTPEQALAILDRFRLLRKFKAIAAHLRLRASMPEPDDGPDVPHIVVADNAAAVVAAAGRLTELGYLVAPPVLGIVGEARDRAFEFASAARVARSRARAPLALIWGGETTVTVRGRGRGGRNLEAALSAAITLDGESEVTIATFATDGVDGATGAAGAIVDGRSAAMARRGGCDPEAYLARNDSLGFFENTGGLITTGPTGTNVNDVWIALAF